MAKGLEEFANIAQNRPQRPFRAKPYYESKLDSLIYYERDERSYESRINRFLTLYLSIADDSLVGFEIKGLKVLGKAIEGMGYDVNLMDPIKVKREDGDESQLEIIMRCAMMPTRVEPQKYQELNDIAKRVSSDELCEA